MEDYSKIIATNLIELRKKSGLTQQDFAKIFAYSDKTISKWELGYATPSVETLKQIADYYDLTVDYFLHPHDFTPTTKKSFMSLESRRILIMLLFDMFFLLAAGTVYAALATAENLNYWIIFIWAIVACSFFNIFPSNKWWTHTMWPYLFSSITIWGGLVGIYLSIISLDIKYNFWYLFFVGLPIQLASIIILKLSHSSAKM